MKKMLPKLFALLTRRERLQVYLLCTGSFVAAVFDVFGVLSIVPFIAVVANPDIIGTNHWLNLAYTSLGFETSHRFLIFLGTSVLGLLIANNLFRALFAWVRIKFIFSSEQSLSRRLLERYLAQPYIFFLNHNTAELGRNILNEASTVIRGILGHGISVVEKSISALFMVVLLLVVNVWLSAGTVLILGCIYGAFYLFIRTRLAIWGKQRLNANLNRFSLSHEAMSGVKDLKVLGREHYFMNRFIKSCDSYTLCASKSSILALMPAYVLEVVAFGGIICIVLYFLPREEGLVQLLPVLAVFAFATRRIMPALQTIFSDITILRYNTASLDIIHADFVITAEVENAFEVAESKPLSLKNSLRLHEVSFFFPGRDEAIIRDLSLEIKANTMIGIVGSTGSGKTTLIDIIICLLAPGSGSIVVDDVPINESNRASWQRNIGYVPQHIYLCDDSAARNIAFAIPDEHIDMERVRHAARVASIAEFIEAELPSGYDTVIGERGVRLSGGQRQRIGIARALYHDPDMLVLDEATSSLDGITEVAVMKSIRALAKRKTIIMIAHRITSVKSCDMIYLMEEGHIIAKGTYIELMNLSEKFRAMSCVSTQPQ